jgi:hypothetical protein
MDCRNKPGNDDNITLGIMDGGEVLSRCPFRNVLMIDERGNQP